MLFFFPVRGFYMNVLYKELSSNIWDELKPGSILRESLKWEKYTFINNWPLPPSLRGDK